MQYAMAFNGLIHAPITCNLIQFKSNSNTKHCSIEAQSIEIRQRKYIEKPRESEREGERACASQMYTEISPGINVGNEAVTAYHMA